MVSTSSFNLVDFEIEQNRILHSAIAHFKVLVAAEYNADQETKRALETAAQAEKDLKLAQEEIAQLKTRLAAFNLQNLKLSNPDLVEESGPIQDAVLPEKQNVRLRSSSVWCQGAHSNTPHQKPAALIQDPIVLILLDGDGCIFNRTFLERGSDGGREAAAALLKNAKVYAERVVGSAAKTMCLAFYNKKGLGSMLDEQGITTRPTFNAFVNGFNEAHPLFSMTDVGTQKEAADSKFRDMLKIFAGVASCKLILAGCAHDGGYASTIQSLETEGFDQIHLLKSYHKSAQAFERIPADRIAEFPDLFESEKFPPFGRQRSLAGGAVATKSAPLNDPDSEIAVASSSREWIQASPKKIPQKLVNLPCKYYYLRNGDCAKGKKCNFVHGDKLSKHAMDELRAAARKIPCPEVLSGQRCTADYVYGCPCISGHVCRLPNCSRGPRCLFTAPGMHPVQDALHHHPMMLYYMKLKQPQEVEDKAVEDEDPGSDSSSEGEKRWDQANHGL